MFCKKCGAEVPEGVNACPTCNTPVESDVAGKAKETFNAAEKSLKNTFNDIMNGPQPGQPLMTDRSLLLFILLNLVTCGLFGLYYIYTIARDLNIACEGDGNNTTGLLLFIILTICTCGIYNVFWWYGVANRLSANAGRYGLTFPENGTTVLLWFIFGWLICFIGPFVAMHIVFKNTNAICAAYNREKGLA
ncbi:DUF4234 domain-containing protein [bacterium]|nr:DUF4234 domain-containing protein [bacterium]